MERLFKQGDTFNWRGEDWTVLGCNDNGMLARPVDGNPVFFEGDQVGILADEIGRTVAGTRPVELSPDEVLALRNCVLPRLVDLEQHGYAPEFDGEAEALRRIGNKLERMVRDDADSAQGTFGP